MVATLRAKTMPHRIAIVAFPLSAGTTITGETLHYPTGGAAHVTAAIAAASL
jgi:hypothetical protein